MPEKTIGLIAAVNTPMNADGDVQLDLIERQAEFLAANGVAGVFVCGTTGESLSLTVDERLRIADRWTQVAPEGLKVIVHVGHPCLPASRALAAAAQRGGAAAIGAMPPIFFRPRSVDELVDSCARVAEAAPEIGFYYYHIPSLTGVRFPVAELLGRAAGRIPNLAGVKFTFEDLMDYAECLALDGGRFDCLFGRDEILLSALVLGARGAIGSTYNFAAPLFLRIIDALAAGDLAAAAALQMKAMAMIRAIHRPGPGGPGFKAVMGMIGLDLGPVRPPLVPLTDRQQADLRAELEEIGFFEFCCK